MLNFEIFSPLDGFASPFGRSGGEATVSNQTIQFGALTLANAGGAKAIASNGSEVDITSVTGVSGASTGWSVSGGRIIRSSPPAAAVLSCVTALGTIEVTISTIANAYSCAATGQLAAVLALGSATIDGATIYGRPGVHIGGVTGSAGTVSFGGTLNFATGLTIESHDANNPCYIRRMDFRHGGNVTFRNMIIRDEYALADNFTTTSIMRSKGGGPTNAGTIFENCEFYSGNVDTYNGAVILSGTAHTNGSSSTTLQLVGSPDLSGIAGDRSMGLRLNASSLLTITGVDNTAKTLTISNAVSIPLASPQPLDIGYIPQNLNVLSQDGGITYYPDFTFQDCNFHDYRGAIVTSYMRSIIVENCDFDRTVGDHILIGVDGNETTVQIKRNRFVGVYGASLDWWNPHVDCIQFNLGPMTVDNTSAYVVEGNLMYSGPGAVETSQGIFLENIPSDRLVKVRIEHNAIIQSYTNGINVQRPNSGSVIRGNTVLFDNSGVDAAPALPLIRLDPDLVAGTLVEYNVYANDLYASATFRNNYKFGSSVGANDGDDYAAVFTGAASDFSSINIVSFAAFRAALTPDTAALWPANKVRIGALSGYYDYDTGVSDAPWDETGFNASAATWGNDVDVVISSVNTSNKVQITGISSTGAEVWFTNANGATMTIYDTNGSSVVASGIATGRNGYIVQNNQYIEFTMTASGTGSTAQTVTIGVGAAATGTWSVTTEAAAAANIQFMSAAGIPSFLVQNGDIQHNSNATYFND
jgi:hypothetical protein